MRQSGPSKRKETTGIRVAFEVDCGERLIRNEVHGRSQVAAERQSVYR